MKCFIDMDGVLTDFAAGYNRKFGLKLPAECFTEERFCKVIGKPIEAIDADLGRDFWATLPWMPKGRSVLALLEARFGADNCYLLTFPSYNAEGATGKIDWVRANLPGYSMRLILATVKHVCAGPDAVLFDDKLRNIKEFGRRHGRAILVPAPWNEQAHNYERILPCLQERIEGYEDYLTQYAGVVRRQADVHAFSA